MKNLLILSFFLLLSAVTKAQCPAGTYDNTIMMPTPAAPGTDYETINVQAWGGDYFLFNVVTGNTYVFRTCFPANATGPNGNINTVLSLYNAAGTTLITFNDDYCGVQSQITWVATFTGQVRLSYYQSGCQTNAVPTSIGVYYTTPCTAPSINTQPLPVTSCTLNNTSFTTTVIGTSPTFQWQVNTGAGFNNITTGGPYSNFTTGTLNVSSVTAAMNGYQYRCVITNACGSVTTTAAALTVNTTNTWTGAVNSDWTTAGNWSCGRIPSSTDDVVVSSGNPVIPSGSTVSCRNLSKSGFASTINLSGATLQIHGDLNYTGGSFTTNSSSTMQFVGSSQQFANGSTPLNVANLTLNNSTGLVMNKNITVSQNLTLFSGKIYTNNNLLTAGSVLNATSNNHIVTGDNAGNPATAGGLQIPIPASSGRLFPVGPVNGSYNPCSITNAAGPAESFTVRVNLSPLPGAPAAQTVQRTWQIDELTIGGNTANLSLQWEAAHEGASFNRSACGIVKSNGTSVIYTGYTLQNGTANNISGTTWIKSLSGVTSFSPWGVTSAPIVLPVQLQQFSVQLNNNLQPQLNWTMAPGSTPAYFEIWRSGDGRQFSFVKRVDAHTGSAYSSEDEQAFKGMNIYRLKLVSVDDEIKYSPLVRINTANTRPEFFVLGNPAGEEIRLQVNLPQRDNIVFTLYNQQGQRIQTDLFALQQGTNTVRIPAASIPAGTYQLVMTDTKGVSVSQPVVKQ